MSTPRVHGLFVGINRYLSPEIGDLSFATNDAKVLWALTQDTFGGANLLRLLDEEATAQAIEQSIGKISSVAESGDLVIIFFAGHGSPDHHLVVHDTPGNGPGIPPEKVSEWLTKLDAKRVLVLLDCCFSGGAGARVASLGSLSRSPNTGADQSLIEKIAGTGALLMAASSPTEVAWEDPRTGHGLFTEALWYTLTGQEHTTPKERISLMEVAESVMRRVEARALALGKTQTPFAALHSNGSFMLPTFVRGAEFRNVCISQGASNVTQEFDVLTSFGYPDSFVNIWRQEYGCLNTFQVEALNRTGLLSGHSAIVVAPTSSGKTLLGELACFGGALRSGRKAIYLVPTKALVNDKYEEFTRRYSSVGVRVARSCGDISDNDLGIRRNKFDIAIFTNEKFLNWIISDPTFLGHVSAVVVDEMQILLDPERGRNLEFILTLVKMSKAKFGHPQLVGLSASIGDLGEIDTWIGATAIRTDTRPVPLREGVISYDGIFRFSDNGSGEKNESIIPPQIAIKDSAQEILKPLLRKLVAGGEKVIVFRGERGLTSGTARYLAKELQLAEASNVVRSIPRGDPSKTTIALLDCLKGGVAFHNSDLTRAERSAIEEDFRDPNGQVKVIVATPTLAMGINTPANSVVIVELEHPGGEFPLPYKVAEYKNMIGRAGRLGYTPFGKAFTVALRPLDAEHKWNQYVRGSLEGIRSSFRGADLPTQIVRILAVGKRLTPDDLVEFYSSSLACHLERHGILEEPEELRVNIEKVLAELLRVNLIEFVDEHYALTELGVACGRMGLEIRSAVTLIEYCRTLKREDLTSEIILAAACATLELVGIHIGVHATSDKERIRWPKEIQSRIVQYPEWARCIQRVSGQDLKIAIGIHKKCWALFAWISGQPMQEIEDYVNQHFRRVACSGAISHTISRSMDVIDAVFKIFSIVTECAGEVQPDFIERLRMRLDRGIPEEIVTIALASKGKLSRAGYLALHAAQIHSVDSLRVRTSELVGLLDEPDRLVLQAAVTA